MLRAYFNNTYECIRLLYRPTDHKDAFLFAQRAFSELMEHGAAVGVEHRAERQAGSSPPVRKDLRVVVNHGFQGVFHYQNATVALGMLNYRGVRPVLEFVGQKPVMHVVTSLLDKTGKTLDDFIMRDMNQPGKRQRTVQNTPTQPGTR